MASNITQAQVGVVVVAGAGTLKGLAVTMPIPATGVDHRTPLTLLDCTAAAGVGPVLYSACLNDLEAFMYATKPSSVPVTPAGPTAPVAGTTFNGPPIAFTQGLYVKSCPAGLTFSFT
jgi:hypothetical protein